MSHAEALDWATYIRKNGPLDLGARLELGFAMLAHLIVNATGGKSSISDFMPHAERKPISLEDAMKEWV